KIDIACQPVTSFVDGHFLISWKDATVTFKQGSNYTILYSTNNNLPLNSWNSLETNNPSQTYLPNFVPGQKYYIRMKVAYPDGNHFIICDTTTVLPPNRAKATGTSVTCSCNAGFMLQDDMVSCAFLPITTTQAATTPSERDVCFMPMEIGTCVESIQAWYYDAEIDSCYMFSYTGCRGNANRFASRLQCMDVCSTKQCHVSRKQAVKRQTPIPTCDESTGNFIPVQCDDLSDECWCVHPESGQEFNESRLKKNVGKPYCSSCKYERDRIIDVGDSESFVPSCSEEGYYSLVQCQPGTGECWCVDQLTGAEITNTRKPLGETVICKRPTLSMKPEDFRVAVHEKDMLKFAYRLPSGRTPS
uniref:Uncharacterized protein n=1 Tax=Romanomermis culicivorax TaxID=13658 RepID=A0A915IH70_ROMCU